MSLLKIYQGHALQQALDEIVTPVTVTYLAVDRPEEDTLTALSELKSMTPHLSVTPLDGQNIEADRLIVKGQQGGDMVFVGAPIGTELPALVSAIVVAGRGDSGLTPSTRQGLGSLPGPVHLQVFTTPT